MSTKSEQPTIGPSKQGQIANKQGTGTLLTIYIYICMAVEPILTNSFLAGGQRRGHDKGTSSSSRGHEDSPRKKVVTVQASPRSHIKGEREGSSRGRSGKGGGSKDSSTSRHDREHVTRGRDSEVHTTSSRHSRATQGEKAHNRRSHSYKHSNDSKSDAHSNKKAARSIPTKSHDGGEEDSHPDSGINLEDCSSSPELAAQIEASVSAPSVLNSESVGANDKNELHVCSRGIEESTASNEALQRDIKIIYTRVHCMCMLFSRVTTDPLIGGAVILER